MAKILKSERRQHPRLEQKLPLKIAANGYDFCTTTENISCVGAYCRVNKYIPPFTKITARLDLPMKSGAKADKCVECSGVIVRTEDENTGGFNIAIFFNHITDRERQKISKYISQFSPSYQMEPPP